MQQQPIFRPASDWRAPTELPRLPLSGRVCVDVETRDPDLRTLGPGARRPDTRLAGVAVAVEGGPSLYVPLLHAGGDNFDNPGAAIRWLRDWAAEFRGEVVGHNLVYDLDFLASKARAEFPLASRFRDTMVVDALIYELHNSYGLDAIASRWGLAGKDEGLLREAAADYGVDPKRDLWALPARYVGPYAEQDARLPLEILRLQEARVREEGLDRVYDVESRLVPVLLSMARLGVRIDEGRLGAAEEKAREVEDKMLRYIREKTGVLLSNDDLNKKAAVFPVLAAIGVREEDLPVTEGGAEKARRGVPLKLSDRQIDDALLVSLDHDVARALRRAKKMNKVRTTFCVSIRRHLVLGRLHCTFTQLRRGDGGARSGRLSSSHPNLQQIPGSRNKDSLAVARLLRAVFLPEEGRRWASLDFAQQEPRIALHFAHAAHCRGARQAVEALRREPGTKIYDLITRLTGLEKYQAKEQFLGTVYGMGPGKFCRRLKLPTQTVYSQRRGKDVEIAGPEGQRIIDRFNAAVPWAREVARLAEGRAREVGHVRTLLGRRVRFPGEPGSYEWTHKALNGAVQGSAADMTKLAMVLAHEEGFRLSLSEHDELDLSVERDEEYERVAEIMETAIPMSVPSLVDRAVGESWAVSLEDD